VRGRSCTSGPSEHSQRRTLLATTLGRAQLPRQPMLLTPDDVADALQVTRDYVLKNLVFERRIDFIKIGGHVRFEPAALEKLIQTGRTEAAK
jgi:excisionase family DNA binding protein